MTKGGVVLVMRVVILRGRASTGDFARGKVHIKGCSEDYLYFFFLYFRYIYSCTLGLVTIIDIHCTYFLYMLMYVYFTYPYMCCFFSFFIHMIHIACM